MKIHVAALEMAVAKQGLNLSKLADRAQVSRQTLSTIKGRKTCRPETLYKLAQALGVDVTEIMEDEANRR